MPRTRPDGSNKKAWPLKREHVPHNDQASSWRWPSKGLGPNYGGSVRIAGFAALAADPDTEIAL
ncbi:MAG: hypothetical protein HY547_09210 [Elusimicrobia bacterium]|nr:hypothetical protein [Elusimicrobiota bacterium]